MKRMMLVAIAGLSLLTGCLVTSSNKEKTEGKYVSENTFAQIETGKTSAGWVKAMLGEPSVKTHDDTSGSDIWKYEYTTVKDGDGTIFLLFSGSNRKESKGT